VKYRVQDLINFFAQEEIVAFNKHFRGDLNFIKILQNS
jgi:hypothetical protein